MLYDSHVRHNDGKISIATEILKKSPGAFS
ncbi:uncharacterized protein METZ01_LOCUS425231, partial [marine metagenome]